MSWFVFSSCFRPNESCDPQSLRANSSTPRTHPQADQLPPQTTTETPTGSSAEDPHETTSSPAHQMMTPAIKDTIHPLVAPLKSLETSQFLSQSPSATSGNSAPSPLPAVTHNASRSPHRTLQNMSAEVQVELFSPPASPHSEALNVSEHPAKALSTPPISPSHPDPFLLTSVTFTSSVSSHLYSPVCSSAAASMLGSLDSPGPAFNLFPIMSSPTSLMTTPLSDQSPPPPELTPPPAQLLGSDDEEQEDPSDYCKGI